MKKLCLVIFLVILNLTIQETNSLSSYQSSSFVLNDNYCDSFDGTDELMTSACAGFPNATFTCSSSGPIPTTIPSSRYQDGICDCCDGSDEIESPFDVKCKNTCFEQLIAVKQAAISIYRTIKSGLRSKEEITSRMHRDKQTNEKTYQSLLNEKEGIMKIEKKLRFYLHKEEPRDQALRARLIRERLTRCAQGEEAYCDYFSSRFFDEKELIISPFLPPNSPEAKNPLNRRRSTFTPSTEIRRKIQSMTGIQRIRATQCEAPEVMPAENMRVFETTGEYLDFMAPQESSSPHSSSFTSSQAKKNSKNKGGAPMSPSAKAALASQSSSLYWQQHQEAGQEETLLEPFLDHGREGFNLAACMFAQLIGVSLSPVILPVQYSTIYLKGLWEREGWSWLDENVQEYRMMMMTSQKEGKEGDSSSSSSQSTPSSSRPFPFTSIPFLSMIPASVYLSLHQFLLDFSNENSSLSQSFSSLMDSLYLSSLVENSDLTLFFDRWTSGLFWFLSMVHQTPQLWVDYYFSPSTSTSLLPMRQTSCLIKTALNNSREELERIENRLKEEENLRGKLTKGGSRQEEDEIDDDENNVVFKNNKNKNQDQTHRSRRNKRTKKEIKSIDFGSENAWESVRDLCLEKQIQQYKYSFCYFKEMKQDSTLIGKYGDWEKVSNSSAGVGEVEVDPSSISSTSASWLFGSTSSSSSSSSSIPASSSQDLFSLSPHLYTSSFLPSVDLNYRVQQYDQQGLRCPTGHKKGQPPLKRRGKALFQCGASHQILTISEPEVCYYEFLIESPLACTSRDEKAALSLLDHLQVFGFTSSPPASAPSLPGSSPLFSPLASSSSDSSVCVEGESGNVCSK